MKHLFAMICLLSLAPMALSQGLTLHTTQPAAQREVEEGDSFKFGDGTITTVERVDLHAMMNRSEVWLKEDDGDQNGPAAATPGSHGDAVTDCADMTVGRSGDWHEYRINKGRLQRRTPTGKWKTGRKVRRTFLGWVLVGIDIGSMPVWQRTSATWDSQN